jgi:hypothetical protein
MEQELTTMSSDEIMKLCHRVNTQLTKQLLDGSSQGEQQERISRVSKISRGLSKRRIAVEDKQVESVDFNRSEIRMPPNE